MRYSQFFIPTLKEKPKDAEVISHSLMLRAGLIRQLTSGVYAYFPLGWKVLHKVMEIIREEMDKAGALEVLLPALNPAKIWQKSKRDKTLSDVLYSFESPHGRNFVLGPTHEEVITDLASKNISSYKQLPKILYQIQTKFRDEPRPRSGVLRSLEFVMKDAYSFDKDAEGLEINYKKMYEVYCNVFKRCGLPYIVVEADPGVMGGNVSHEFMVVSDNGEDRIAICNNCGYAASLEVARCTKETRAQKPCLVGRPASRQAGRQAEVEELKEIKEVDTPGITTVNKVSKLLNVGSEKLLKTLIFEVDDKQIVVLIRGDCEVNETKLKRALNCKKLSLANDEKISKITNAPVGFSGPVGLKDISMIADYSVFGMKNFVTGANKRDKHLINVNIGRDFKIDRFEDIKYIKSGNNCPECTKKIDIKNSIEVGHIFKLGTKYSKTFKANFLDSESKKRSMIMGCYGIGVSRIIAACIESNCDKDGIIWPLNVAPFEVIILPVTIEVELVNKVTEKIYSSLKSKGIAVLMDDRDERAGVKFNDADLIGIPYRIIIGEKSVSQGKVELQNRKDKKSQFISIEESDEKIIDYINTQKKLANSGR